MKNLKRIQSGLFLICLLLSLPAFSQNMETMYIEKIAGSIVFPEQCSPDDMVIIINSSLPDLKFESNMLPVEEFIVIHNEKDNQYIICHEKIKFKLTVSGPNLQSEDIDIFDMEKPLALRITANTAKGVVNIITNPRNATVIFPELDNLVLSSNQPIKNNSGKYRVKIVKAQYKNVDTTIVIPRDAEKTYNIELVPLFSRIKLDLRTSDNSTFLKAPVLWIDSVKIELEGLIKPGQNMRNFWDDIEYLKFYEGNIVPLTEGIHKIKIEAESYIPYETTVQAKNGKLHNISVTLEPIFGYLTFVDKQFSEGATILINNKEIGKVPMFKVKSKVGTHKIRFIKPGYIPLEEEYTVQVAENKITDIDVVMQVARKITFETNPASAEVLMDGNRIGFTPVSSLVNAGTHEILIRKSGYATEKITKDISDKTPAEENVKFNLRQVNPLSIDSEKDGLAILLEGKNENQNIAIENTFTTPASIPLPYGKYEISLLDNKKTVYKSTINHQPQIAKRGKLPNYSRSSFRLLEGSIGFDQGDIKLTAVKKLSDITNFEASFGRIHVFPGSGLSSALLNVDYQLYDLKSPKAIDDKKQEFQLNDTIFHTIAPNFFFLNWDWRVGGAVLRQFDVNLIGRVKYTPGLKIMDQNISKLTDVDMLSYFYGIELSTRISGLNVCFRYGRQTNNGKINLWDAKNKKYWGTIDLDNQDKNVASIGISFAGKVSKSNQMLRLWHKPLLDPAKKKIRIKEEKPIKTEQPETSEPKLLDKIKFWKKTDKTE